MSRTPDEVDARWAIYVERGDREFIAGRFCFPDGNDEEPPKRTYRTREQARAALKTCCYRRNAKVVRVLIRYSVVEWPGKKGE